MIDEPVSVLLNLQEDIAQRILDDLIPNEEGLQTLAITTEAKGSLDTQIQDRIAKAGIGIVVATPQFESSDTPDQITVTVVLVITENVIANQGTLGTRRTVTEIAETLYAYLHNWQPTVEAWSPLVFASFATRDADPDEQILFHTMTLTTSTITEQTVSLN
jgi:hypothetical protein